MKLKDRSVLIVCSKFPSNYSLAVETKYHIVAFKEKSGDNQTH